MAKDKDKAQKELELEEKNKQKAEDSDGQEEVVVVSDEDNSDKDVKGQDIEKTLKDLQDRIAKSDEERKKDQEARKFAEDRAERLERERGEHEEKAKKAENRAALTQKEAIAQSLVSSQQIIESAESDLEAALGEGDAKKVVAAQKKLSEATYMNADLRKQKSQYDAWEKQQEELAKQPKVQQLPPSVQNWIDKNPRYKSDPEFKAEADGAHDVAVRRGYAFGSSAYLSFIDSRMKQIFAEDKVDDKDDDDKDDERDNKRYSAPPNRGGSSSDDDDDDDDTDTRAKRKVYKLTAAQREAAKISNMTELQYAQFLEAEKKRGRN